MKRLSRALSRKWLTVCFLTFAVALRADVVVEWNALMLDAIRLENTGPTVSTRNLAILHTAIYDAVNSITRTHQPYRLHLHPPEEASPEAAAVGAAYQVTALLYPSALAWASDLYRSYVHSSSPNAGLTNGLHFGRLVGSLTVEGRGDDGANTEVPYVPGSEAGQWQRTPPFYRPPLTPHWRYVDPFCLPEIEQFVPNPPPALDSPEYAESLNEVKAMGGRNSTLRTPEQGQIAVFWSDFSYTAMPPGHWHEIAATIAAARGHTLSENARLFALVSLVQADAAIVCWEAKFRYNLWRPISAIHRADEDANAATERDSSWDHYLPSPPFPTYTSGHSTFSQASATVLTRFYGTDAVTFTAASDSLPGVFRTFTSLAACADEIGMSRIYGGIHFPFDNLQGKRTGRAIGEYIAANFLLPNAQLPALQIESAGPGGTWLRVHGVFGAACVLEASSDLRQWQPISTNAATLGGNLILDPQLGMTERRYYRVRQRPDATSDYW